MSHCDVRMLNKAFRYDGGRIFYNREYGSRGRRIRAYGKRAGGVTGCGRYRSVSVGGKRMYEHRIIWMMHNGLIPDGMEIDHINGDGMDNRIENLRLAWPHQNHWNEKRPSQAGNLPKGVARYKTKSGDRFSATVKFMRKPHRRCAFKSIIAAKEWLKKTRKELHGEFARAS